MNIDSLVNKINLFDKLVIESGFKRDVADFHQAIQKAENQNLIFMKDIAKRVESSFHVFENYGLNSELEKILRDTKPFTSGNAIEEIDHLNQQEQLEAPDYFNKINKILKNLLSAIDQNNQEIRAVQQVFQKYTADEPDVNSQNHFALMSLIFRDAQSTSNLKEFSKILSRWDRTLMIAHRLLKSESPEQIPLVQIQNGSIDVIFNIDFNVALDLTELIQTGIYAFTAFLVYKDREKEIKDSYADNDELLKLEVKKEQLLLENIKTSIRTNAKKLHIENLKIDTNIEKDSIDVKIEEVASAIADHIVKGNELKLLKAPDVEDEESKEEHDEASSELQETTALVKEHYKKLDKEDQKLLLEKYTIKDNEDE